jgi:PKD repeat protein
MKKSFTSSRIKKFLVTLVIVALAGNFLLSVGNVSHAFDFGSAGDWGKLFGGGGTKALSFTNYEGGLATLDKGGYDSALTASTDLKSFILKVVNYALGFLGLIAVLVVIYAGVSYVISNGEDEKTGKAKKMITYAAIGLLIVMGSFAFVNTVISSALVGDGSKGTTGKYGSNVGGGFNAIAEEVKGIAVDIYSGYAFLADTTQEFKNIQTELKMASLQRAALPTKATITTFLRDTKSKLLNLKLKVKPLSEIEAAINVQVLALEMEIDKINTTIDSQDNSYLKSDGTTVKTAKDAYSKWDQFVNGYTEGSTGVNVPESEGFINFDGGIKLLNDWDDYKDLLATDLNEIVPLFGNDYAINLKKNIDRLIEINDSIKGISAVGDPMSAAQKAFEDMLGNADKPEGLYDSLWSEVVTNKDTTPPSKWMLSDTTPDIDGIAGLYLVPGMEAHSKYYEALLTIQFVNAKLHADVVQGNAPLTVIFDTGDSVDPAGGSIDGTNIIWDPAGTQTIDGVLGEVPTKDTIKLFGTGEYADNKGVLATNNDPNMIYPKESIPAILKCDNPTDIAKDISSIGRRCTFNKPGTYLATVIINSNDPTKVGPGISVIKIVANPPVTKINLEVYPENGPEYAKTVMKYDGDNVTTEESAVNFNVALDLVFDAKTSSPTPQSYKWNFGNGKSTEFSASNATVTKAQYGSFKLGAYEITLEVMNANGVVDKKIFTLQISSIDGLIKALFDQKKSLEDLIADGVEEGEAQAQIEKKTNKVYVNTPVTFDGSGSSAAKGNEIIDYAWEVNKVTDETKVLIIDSKSSGPAKKTFQYSFTEPGEYTVVLTVTGADKTKAESDFQVFVKSKNPTAAFSYTTQGKGQPGTYNFKNMSVDSDSLAEDLRWEWTVTPSQPQAEGATKKQFELLNGTAGQTTINVKNPIIKFNEVGDYEVKLKVTMSDTALAKEKGETTQKITVNNVLDVAWDKATQKTTTKIATPFIAAIKSDNATAYEIDFGDGETAKDEFASATGTKTASVTHEYKQSGKYILRATVYDADDNENTIQKKVLVNGGDQVLAAATLLINGEEVMEDTEIISVTRSDKLTFSAAKSLNTDGTGRKLKYSWDFMDQGVKSSQKEATHIYKELSPKDKGFYEVTLTVYDESDPTKKSAQPDILKINVVNEDPYFTSLSATPLAGVLNLVTPALISLKANGATDPDGKIIEYRWWYFDLANDAEQLGMLVTQEPQAQLTIGAKGDTGKKIKYGFGLEIKDNDGMTYSNIGKFKTANDRTIETFPKIEVANEKNEPPVAKFNIDKAKAFTGEEVTFTSSSTDADGKIKTYVWDFEGDGFYNDTPTDQSTVKHTYDKKNMEGYAVKLKVIDDKGSENDSATLKIYIDAKAKAPTAAFTHEVVAGTNGKTIEFTNTSKADDTAGAKIIKNSWDFDLDTDSDGDGSKSNDTDSTAANPEHTYNKNGTYQVKLTVTDDQGNKDEITNELKVPLANPPTVDFTYQANNTIVAFKNTSTADEAAGAKIDSYVWDFDTSSILPSADTNKDGTKDNDEDSTDRDPNFTFPDSGTYQVKLTVKDDQGNTKNVTKAVTVSVVGGSTPGVTTPGTTNSGVGTIPAGTVVTDIGAGIRLTDKPNVTIPTTPITPPVTPNTLVPKLITTPAPNADGIIYLMDGEYVKFDYSQSEPKQSISLYMFDNNIYYDTNGNGIKDDDAILMSRYPGNWQVSFKKSEGPITVKFVIMDINGNQQTILQPIKFK